MLTLLDENEYQVDCFAIKVIGLRVNELSAIIPICSNVDRKVKQKILEAVQDDELAGAIQKTSSEESLTPAEILKLSSFTKGMEHDFTLEECQVLFDACKNCIKSVTRGSDDITADFLAAVPDSPKYLLLMGHLIYQEYKNATEIPELKKT